MSPFVEASLFNKGIGEELGTHYHDWIARIAVNLKSTIEAHWGTFELVYPKFGSEFKKMDHRYACDEAGRTTTKHGHVLMTMELGLRWFGDQGDWDKWRLVMPAQILTCSMERVSKEHA